MLKKEDKNMKKALEEQMVSMTHQFPNRLESNIHNSVLRFLHKNLFCVIYEDEFSKGIPY